MSTVRGVINAESQRVFFFWPLAGATPCGVGATRSSRALLAERHAADGIGRRQPPVARFRHVGIVPGRAGRPTAAMGWRVRACLCD